ncbi:unnamed protein product [Mytilus coruscus]|uniref:Integrase catalytic domain-containing protein n=1 Tax=Mytilus coruscus TaxID=42192 RepID=A0A6J8CAB7_MYTCO|nr:unnamed protein product [Mytilus coruscus]
MDIHNDIEYKNTNKHTNGDALSRIPRESKESDGEEFDAVDVSMLKQLENICFTNDNIRRETARDKILPGVYEYVQKGWTVNDDKDLTPYFNRRNELSISQGCLQWRMRTIVPTKFRQQTLELLHSVQPGVGKMKLFAKSYVWWPRIDSEIESLARSCSGCQKHQRNPKQSLHYSWLRPSSQWKRVHIDFDGPCIDYMFLIATDAYSKWPEVIPMKRTTSTQTIRVLRTIFARAGLPEQIVSDNGPQFVSYEFKHLLK